MATQASSSRCRVASGAPPVPAAIARSSSEAAVASSPQCRARIAPSAAGLSGSSTLRPTGSSVPAARTSMDSAVVGVPVTDSRRPRAIRSSALDSDVGGPSGSGARGRLAGAERGERGERVHPGPAVQLRAAGELAAVGERGRGDRGGAPCGAGRPRW